MTEWQFTVCCPEIQEHIAHGNIKLHYLRKFLVLQDIDERWYWLHFCPFCGERVRYYKK